MWIKKGDFVELTAKDNVFFDGIIHDIVVIKNEDQIEAAILLSQQEHTNAEEFGDVVMPMSEITSIDVVKEEDKGL